jgi:hypothetical protein
MDLKKRNGMLSDSRKENFGMGITTSLEKAGLSLVHR